MGHSLAHFITITKHRHQVMKNCFKVGLYKQGLLHDLSKYSPTEFRVGAKYYQGDRSPNNAEREETGISLAWLHHKGRNKHHFEYWMDYSMNRGEGIVGMPMPANYVVEMVMDRIAASKIYMGDRYSDSSPLEYYRAGKLNNLMHPQTLELLERLLEMLAERGEKETFEYIRREVLHNIHYT